MGKGMFYFKCDLSMMQDEKIEDVIDEYGAWGLGIWVACLIHIYRYGNEAKGNIPTKRLVRKVARDTGEDEARVEEAIGVFNNLGLFNNEVFNNGRIANERASETIVRHLENVRRGRENVSKRWEGGSKTAGE